jgi:hypothetical protein
MSGGVVQLVATGAQDEWLTGKPEVSFYRSNYKRHTHYSASAERQIIQGTPLAGGISTIRFEKKGDLMNYVYFIGKDSTGATVPGVDWSKVIDKVELLIGGQVIDTQDMVWMTQVEPVPGAQNYSTRYLNTNPTGLTNVINGFLPLKFFFCKDWSSSLPLVALQYHDIEIRITWSSNLGYRVSYEIYSVAASSTITAPSFTPSGVVTTTAGGGSTPFTSSAAAAQTATITATLGGAAATATGFTGGAYTAATLPTVTAAGGLTGAAATLTPSFGTGSLTLGGTPGSGPYATVYGSGWTGAPVLTLTGSGTATAVMGLAALTLSSGGTNFTASQAALPVTFTGATMAGQYAYATGTVVTNGSGVVTAVTVTTPGFGYTAVANLTVTPGSGGGSGVTFTNVSLGIFSTTITAPGSGVVSVAALTIPTSPGTGTGATLTPVLTVVSIAASGGTGYLNGAALSFSGGTATTPASGGTISVTTASRSQPAGTFTYSGANFQMVPGAFFTPSGLGADIIVVSVTATSSTSGTFTGYLSAAGTASVLTISGSQALAGYKSALGTISITNSIDFTTGGPSYTSRAITYTMGTPPLVNTVLSSFNQSASPGTNATAYISAVSINSDTDASVTITVIGARTGAAAPGSAPFTATGTAGYPILNMSITAPTSGTITSGMSMLGFAIVGNQNAFIPTVANVYSSTLISVATNQFQVASTAAAPVLKAIVTMDAQYNASSLFFVPTNYYTGSVGTSIGALGAGGVAAGSAAAVTAQYTTLNGAAASSYPTIGATVLFVKSGAVIGNCYVQTGTSSTSFSITYTDSAAGTIAAYTQFIVVPQVAARAQLAVAQPATTNSGVVTLSLTGLVGTTPIAVGQQVIGTAYTGPVTVTQVISQGAFSASSSAVTATIEVSFPPLDVAVPTTTGAGTLIQFIDTTAPLGSGVTVSTNSYTTTYQNLQYEAWCNFVYLDQKERDFFAKTTQDMLITQVQRISIQNATYQEISIAQPVKYIAFLSNNYSTAYQQSQTAGYPAATSYYLKTQINGVDVGDSRSMLQWQDVTQYYHTPYGYNNMGYVAPVALIPYCLDTSKLQPTGTLNFSRLDTYRLVAPTGSTLLQLSGGAAYFYAVNYNILRIQNGLGGLLYAN